MLGNDIYTYNKLWDNLSDTEINNYQSYIKNINNSDELLEKLIELSPNGIIIFTENKKLKNTIKSHVQQIVRENQKTGKITNIIFGDYLLYDTPRTCIAFPM